jgi:hypothetical protein
MEHTGRGLQSRRGRRQGTEFRDRRLIALSNGRGKNQSHIHKSVVAMLASQGRRKEGPLPRLIPRGRHFVSDHAAEHANRTASSSLSF